jgi:hypothetical protein
MFANSAKNLVWVYVVVSIIVVLVILLMAWCCAWRFIKIRGFQLRRRGKPVPFREDTVSGNKPSCCMEISD